LKSVSECGEGKRSRVFHRDQYIDVSLRCGIYCTQVPNPRNYLGREEEPHIGTQLQQNPFLAAKLKEAKV
jgi:hypothetical protein